MGTPTMSHLSASFYRFRAVDAEVIGPALTFCRPAQVQGGRRSLSRAGRVSPPSLANVLPIGEAIQNVRGHAESPAIRSDHAVSEGRTRGSGCAHQDLTKDRDCPVRRHLPDRPRGKGRASSYLHTAA